MKFEQQSGFTTFFSFLNFFFTFNFVDKLFYLNFF